MKITEAAEAELLEVCKDLTPQQQAFLRTWLLTSQIPLSLTMCGATFSDWETWKQSSGFIKTYEKVRRLRTRRYMFQLRKLLAAALGITVNMSEAERKRYAKLVGDWGELDLLEIAADIARGQV